VESKDKEDRKATWDIRDAWAKHIGVLA